MNTYSFDVEVSTHELLKAGVLAGRFFGSPAHHHRVVVAATSFTEARLVAAQMASCHGICTRVFTRV